jgi:asparagine synthase (glutamine-hydrolysing)
MCGIFSLLNNAEQISLKFIEEQFQKGRSRGPEFSILKTVMVNVLFGFHRLAINGLNTESNQPIIIGDIGIVCNGEIYNYKELYKMMNVEPKTDSDCEVIIHMYKKYGIEQTLNMLDGVFSFILIDYRLSNTESKLFIARDPYGVRPLYFLRPCFIYNQNDHVDPDRYAFASELKMLTNLSNVLNIENQKKYNSVTFRKNYKHYALKKYNVYQFLPGTYMGFELSTKVCSYWEPTIAGARYHKIGLSPTMFIDKSTLNMETIYRNINTLLTTAVEKRCCTTERPIACLLSGGLDSSLITALVNDYHVKYGLPRIETYSIGLEGSVDLEHARIVADYLGTKHTEIILTEQDFLDAIPQVIYAIESFDTTTVRASIGNWLLGKYISENSDAKVIFNGDGSDELAGGYLYMNYSPDDIEFDKESRRLLDDIHLFDVLRSDKSISSHGLEPRTPFLDRVWTQYYMSIPAEIRNHNNSNNIEKYLIRKSFSSEEGYWNSQGLPLLPDKVLWRRKEAFSDGVSKHTRSLYEIIQEYAILKFVSDDLPLYPFIESSDNMYEHINKLVYPSNTHLVPKTAEQFYYRKIFESHYPEMAHIIPYFWMPKFVDAKDASARTLNIYVTEQSGDNLV